MRKVAIATALDVVSVLLFVAIGRREHDETGAAADVLEVAAPFLIGLAVGWLASVAWRAPMTLRTGILIWPVTVVVGMVLRRVVWDDGTALAFVIVATLFLGLCLVGWRAIARVVTRP